MVNRTLKRRNYINKTRKGGVKIGELFSKSKEAISAVGSKVKKGSVALGNTLRESASAKFLITRIINPANPDRILFKNAFFLEFIDEDEVKKNVYKETEKTPNSERIKIVEQCNKYYIYKEKYINGPTANNNNNNTEILTTTNTGSASGNIGSILTNLGSLLSLGGTNDDPVSSSETNDDQNSLSKDVDSKLEELEKKKDNVQNFLEDKPRNCFSIKDTLNRKPFIKLNDTPLVDRELIDDPSNKYNNKYKDCIGFYKDFDPLYKILHIYKYQINRVLWTPSEMIYFKRIKYLFKGIYQMINNNASLKPVFLKVFEMSLLISSICNPNAKHSFEPANENNEELNKQIAEEAAKKDGKDEDVDVEGVGLELGEKNGSKTMEGGGLSEINITGILLKFYDIDPPYTNTNSLKYILPVLRKKFPPFMEREAKFAIKTAIKLLKEEKSKQETNGGFSGIYTITDPITDPFSEESEKEEKRNLKILIEELNLLNPGKHIEQTAGTMKLRRHKQKKSKKTRKIYRSGGVFSNLSNKVSSVKNSVSNLSNKVSNKVSSKVSSAYSHIDKQKKFFDVIQQIFEKCYEKMIDRRLEDCSKLTENQEVILKGKSMKEHVANFFLILHECTFFQLFNIFSNTLLFNLANVYNPLLTLGPVMNVSIGSFQPFKVPLGALTMIPTIHTICCLRLMASEIKNASVLLDESFLEQLRRVNSNPFSHLTPCGNIAPAIEIDVLYDKDTKKIKNEYKNIYFQIETNEFSNYGKIVEITNQNESTCDSIYYLKIKYYFQEMIDIKNKKIEEPKLIKKIKQNVKGNEEFIKGSTVLNKVFKCKVLEDDTITMFFNKNYDKSMYSVFEKGIKDINEKLKTEKKMVSLNDNFLGQLTNIKCNHLFLGASKPIKSVTFTIQFGKENANFTIKYNEIGVKGFATKKYFQAVEIIPY